MKQAVYAYFERNYNIVAIFLEKLQESPFVSFTEQAVDLYHHHLQYVLIITMIFRSTLYRTTLFASMSIAACVGDQEGMDSSLSNPFVPRSIEAARKKDPDLVAAARRSVYKKKLHSMLLHRSSDNNNKNSSQGNGGSALRNAAAFEDDGDGDQIDLGIIETNHPDADGQEPTQDHSKYLHQDITEDALDNFYTNTMEDYFENNFQDFYKDQRELENGEQECPERPVIGSKTTDLLKVDGDGYNPFRNLVLCQMGYSDFAGFYGSCEDYYLTLYPGVQVSCFNTSLVTDMSRLFQYVKVPDISQWDVSSVTNMYYMFLGASQASSIASWDVSSVKKMRRTFVKYQGNPPVGTWNVSSVTDMSEMFYNARSANPPIRSWDTSSVKDMAFIFYGAESFNQPIDSWNLNSLNAFGANGMFFFAKAFNQCLSTWPFKIDRYFDYNPFCTNACMFSDSGCENKGNRGQPSEEGPWCKFESEACPALTPPTASPTNAPTMSPGPSPNPSSEPSPGPSNTPTMKSEKKKEKSSKGAKKNKKDKKGKEEETKKI